MNVRALLGWRLRGSDRIGDASRRLDDVRLLRQVRILWLLDHAVQRASAVPAT